MWEAIVGRGGSATKVEKGSWADIAATKRVFLRGSFDYRATVKLVHPEYQCLLEPIEKLRDIADLQQLLRGCGLKRLIITPFTPQMFFECLGAE
jgi:hypothetical protein